MGNPHLTAKNQFVAPLPRKHKPVSQADDQRGALGADGAAHGLRWGPAPSGRVVLGEGPLVGAFFWLSLETIPKKGGYPQKTHTHSVTESHREREREREDRHTLTLDRGVIKVRNWSVASKEPPT